MESRLCLKVYLNKEAYKNQKSVFERIVYFDNSVMFPFNKVTETFKLLFGQKCVINICTDD